MPADEVRALDSKPLVWTEADVDVRRILAQLIMPGEAPRTRRAEKRNSLSRVS
jgi:hypothetical protein